MMRAASRRLVFTCGAETSRTAMAKSSGTMMLSRNGETERVPGFSGWKPNSVLAVTRAEARPASESSNATAGGGSFQSELMESRIAISLVVPTGSGCSNHFALTLNKRHLVDLFQSSHALQDLLHRRISQKRHAFLARHPLDLRSRPFLQNQLADMVAQIQQFMNRRPPAGPRAAALEAAG